MGELPKPPTQVSSSGLEIWDWADRFSNALHRHEEERRLSAAIRDVGRGCGDCEHWMKSRECPRESNANGQQHGPPMSGPICGNFSESRQATRRREMLVIKLNAINETTP